MSIDHHNQQILIQELCIIFDQKLTEGISQISAELLRPSVIYKAVLSCLPVRVESTHVTHAMTVEFGRWGELFEDCPKQRPLWVADNGPCLHGYGATPEEAMRDFDRKWLNQK